MQGVPIMNLVWTNRVCCANYRCCYFQSLKNCEKLAKLMHCCQIRHNFKCIKYLCKLCKEHLITSLTNLETFDIPPAFLRLTVTKLSILKNGPVFWPTLYDVQLSWLQYSLFTASPGRAVIFLRPLLHGGRTLTSHLKLWQLLPFMRKKEKLLPESEADSIS